MAISSTYTWMPIDYYAKCCGLNPAHFNGGGEISLADGRKIFPLRNAVQDIWPQYSWQSGSRLSIEDLSQSIRDAELEISKLIGFNLVPDWVTNESHQFDMNMFKFGDGYSNTNPVTGHVELKPNLSWFVAGGVRKTTLIGTPAILRVDTDGDGFAEVFRVVQDVSAIPACVQRNIKFYIAGKGAERIYEVRWPYKLSINPITKIMTADFNFWLCVDQDLRNAFPTDEDSFMIDMQDANSFIKTIDVYYEENDTSQSHVSFYSQYNGVNNLVATGYINKSPGQGGFIETVAANYINSAWQHSCASSIPYTAYLNYHSGYSDSRMDVIGENCDLTKYFGTTIFYLATARLSRIFMSNENATSMMEDLRRDYVDPDKSSFYPEALENPFGTRVGEVKAWLRVKNFLQTDIKFALL